MNLRGWRFLWIGWLVIALGMLTAGAVLADDQPDGSTLISPQTTDGTWGPGVITATSNVVINAGVTITVAPGTTIVVNGNYTLTVNGTLRVNGPVTFTHPAATPGSWGGIVYAPGSSGYLDGVTIEYAQRGLTLNTANPIVVSNSTIRYNRHTVSGAGIYLQSGNHQITGTLIYNNEVAGTGIVYGGGVFIENNSSQLLNSRIYNNTVTSTGNKGGGGGVMILRSSGTVAPLVEGCEIATNTLRTAGSSSLANGAGIGIEGTTGAVIRNNRIADNQSVPTAGYGGGGGIGFEQDARAALIDANLILNNLSMGPGHSEGGGIDCWGGNVVTVTNNLLYNNRSRTIGGGMNINANAGTGLNVNVLNNTVVSNTSASGGGLYLQSNGVALNNVAVGNLATTSGGGIYRASGTADYNDVWNNTAPSNPNTYGTMGANTLYVDPLFIGSGDLAQQYRLQNRSPVIDKGTNSGIGLPSQDYDGDARPLFCSWDMGFDEVTVGPSTIQCMIDLAAPGETVIVPAGVYTESLILSKPVSVTGVSSATVIVRAPANQRVMYITGTMVTNDVLIAGMTFENGNTAANGGGVYITGGAQPRFEDMTFTNNIARYRGGAIFMDSPGSTLIVRRSRFTGNRADYNNDNNTRGAAVAVSGADLRLILENVQMIGNSSERYGGAIAVEGNVTPAHLVITDSLINDNTASELDGGAIFGSLAVITVTHSTLDNNRAPSGDRMGGAVYLTGVGSRLTLIGSTLSNNLGYRQGGAIYASGNDTQINVLDGSILTGNSTADNDTYAYGGAIYLYGNRAALTISASTVSTNTSVNYGGAIYMDGNSDTDQARLTITDSQINANEATTANGGGIWADQTLVSITNSTVDGNRAPTASRVGGGIYLTGLNTALTLDRSSVSRNLVGRTGAGIYASGNTIQMVVRNGSVIDGNESTEDNDGAQGGGIYLYGIGVRLDVADSSISNNIAERFGGGVYLYNNSNTIIGQLTVSRSQINANEATDRSGGGLYTYQSAVTITQSTLNDNRAPDTSGDWAGGALYMGGAGSNLTLTDSTVTGNTAAAYGGGIYLSNTTAQVIIANSVISGNVTLRDVTANTGGGGLYLSAAGASRLTISDSIFANNRAQRAGGALFYYGATTSVFSVTDSRFTGNQAVTNNGGGLYVRQAAATLTRVTVSGNTANGAGADGGGLYLEGSGAASTFDPIEVTNNTANDLGGGIYAGSTLTLRNATVRGNTTNNRGGGIYAAGGTLTINDSILAQNVTYVAADGDGGAIYTAVNLTLNNTRVISNTANDDGGGIYGSAGTVTLNDSTLNGNATGSGADADGGALYVNGNTTLTRVTVRGNTANRYGGGIYRNGGNVTLDRSTLAENTSGSSGGALYMAGGTLTTANSTFSGNRTLNGGGDGGALWVNTNATLYNTTIFNNTAAGLGGGIRRASAGTIVFRNSLVVGNSPANCSGAIATTGVSNLADDATCGSNFTNNPNAARLGPLADNGGPTWTHLLRPGNPAFNAGDAATCAASPVNGIDQRGVTRPQGAQCDIGAVEATATLALTKSSANEGGDPLRPGERITYTLWLVNESPLDNTGAVITDAIPSHTTFIPGSLTVQPPSAGGTPGVQPVLVSNLTVAAGSVVTVTFAVTVDRPLDTGDLIVNTASARSDQVANPLSSTITDTVVATPQVRVIKQGPAMANVGSTAVYTFSVSNPGDTRLHNLTIWDDLTGAATYLSGDDGNGWLDLNETWVYTATYVILPTAPNSIANTVTVTATDAADVVVTDSDTHTLSVVYNPLLALTKSGPVKANIGDTVTFTFTVAHASGSDGSPISGVSVMDDIAGPATYLSGDDGDSLLESGETWLWTAAHTLQITDPDPLVNTATASGLDPEGDAITATATHSLDINFAPVAVDDTAVTDEETAIQIAVLTNDGDPDGDPLVIIGMETVGTSGSVTNNVNYVTYNPGLAFQYLGAGESATDTFRYTITDGVFTGTATVTVTVNGINDPPTISAVVDQVTDEDTPVGPLAFTVGDVEPPAADLTVTAASSNPALLPVSGIALGGSGAERTVTLTPAPDQFGTAVVTLTVSDGDLSAFTAFTLTVTAANDAPTISVIADQTTAEDTAVGPVSFTVGDVETPAADLVVTAASGNLTLLPVSGIALGGSGADRTVTLTPAPDQFGTAVVTLTVSDGDLSAQTAFTLTVQPVNDPPTISPLADQVADEDTPVGPLAFTVGDVETPAADLAVTAASSNPTLVPVSGIALGGSGADRTVTLTPAPDQFGTAVVTLTVSDGNLSAATAFTLTVQPVNDPPVAQDDEAATAGAPVSIAVLLNDTDVEQDPLTVVAVGGPANGAATTDGTTVVYTPTNGFVGMEVFTYTIGDGQGGLATATITVTVGDAPITGLTATNSSPTVLGQPTAFTATVSSGFNVSFTWDFGDGTAGNGATPTHIYPAAGTYTAVVTATNGASLLTTTTAVLITNAPPVASAGADQVVFTGAAVTLDGSASYDPDGHLPLTYHWEQTGGPAVTLSDPADPQPAFTAPAEPASLSFSLVVTDAMGMCSTPAVVTVSVIQAVPPQYRVYLPLVLRTQVTGPDLVVTHITATATGIQVVIKNQGNLPVPADEEHEFWVDVYLNPNPAPTAVNQTWQHVASQGLVWGVTVEALPALVPGGVLTLTSGGPYYRPDESRVTWPLPAGTVVYAQVDSANANTSYGAVWETHEMVGGPYNNITGPVVATTAAGVAAGIPVGEEGTLTIVTGRHLPPRP